MEKEKQCDFCSMTQDYVGVLYKGILDARICDKCIKIILTQAMTGVIDRMDLHDPLNVKIKNIL